MNRKKEKVVPKRIRFKVYKEALYYLSNKLWETDKALYTISYSRKLKQQDGFCFIFTAIIHNISDILVGSMVQNLTILFPELEQYKPHGNENGDGSLWWTYQERIEILTKIIKDEKERKSGKSKKPIKK